MAYRPARLALSAGAQSPAPRFCAGLNDFLFAL